MVFHEQHFPFYSDFSFPVVSESPLSPAHLPSFPHDCLMPSSSTNVPPNTTSHPASPFTHGSSSPTSPSTSSPPDIDAAVSPSVAVPDSAPASPSFNPDTATPAPSSIPLRKSDRPHNPPSYLNDYIYKLPNSLSCSSSKPVKFEPYTYSQAAPIPAWQDAMRKEFEALEAHYSEKSGAKEIPIKC